jgi:hypothetical protein
MITQKLEIRLHDNSQAVISRTDGGQVYVEVYGPGFATDGHGFILRGSALLDEATRNALVTLLASPAERKAA